MFPQNAPPFFGEITESSRTGEDGLVGLSLSLPAFAHPTPSNAPPLKEDPFPNPIPPVVAPLTSPHTPHASFKTCARAYNTTHSHTLTLTHSHTRPFRTPFSFLLSPSNCSSQGIPAHQRTCPLCVDSIADPRRPCCTVRAYSPSVVQGSMKRVCHKCVRNLNCLRGGGSLGRPRRNFMRDALCTPVLRGTCMSSPGSSTRLLVLYHVPLFVATSPPLPPHNTPQSVSA